MTNEAGTVALSIIYEGLLLKILSIMMKKKASSKKHTQFKTRVISYCTAQKQCTRKNFFLRPQEEVLLAADCGSLELDSWKPQELLCGCMIKAQELLCGRMFEPQELLCGSLKGTRQGTRK